MIPAIAFSQSPLSRQSENRSPSCITQALSEPSTKIMFISDKRLIFSASGNSLSAFFTVSACKRFNINDDEKLVLLGRDHENKAYIAASCDLDLDALPDDLKAFDFRSVYIQGLVDEKELGILAQGAALIAWHHSHQFCSCCGGKSSSHDGGYKRVCRVCGTNHFPRTDPVVIMLVVSPDRKHVLLGRSPHFPEGMYSCLAGFLEPGETIEDAARREVLEESGVKVGSVTYSASQPWPFPHTLMIGCYGYATSEDIVRDDELEDVQWFSKHEMQTMMQNIHPRGFKMPNIGSIAYYLIKQWLDSH